MTRIDIAMCVDRGFVLPLAVTLASLDRVSSGDEVTVHIAHPGLSPETRARVSAPLDRIDLVWHLVDERMLADARPSVFLSPASMYRLLLGSVLPAELERVVYLDADTLVLGSLAELATADLGQRPLGAVREAASPWAAGPLGPDWRTLGLAPAAAYFNSGMLVIDLVQWREQDSGEACLELTRGRQLRWGDQDALNTVFEGRWAELPRRWNLQSVDADGSGFSWGLWPSDVADAVRRPGIVHYTGRTKPWMPGGPEEFRAEWYESLDRTMWRGWRPETPRASPLVSSGLRVGRALKRALVEREVRLPR
jgi:lipopolysaccharide biosynthesis glycosyltransferase